MSLVSQFGWAFITRATFIRGVLRRIQQSSPWDRQGQQIPYRRPPARPQTTGLWFMGHCVLVVKTGIEVVRQSKKVGHSGRQGAARSPQWAGWLPKSAPVRFGCKQRKACNNTGVGYGGAVSTRSGGTPVRTVRAELACLSLSAVRSRALLLKSPIFNGKLVPKIQLAILKTSKNMSWPRLARPRDLVGSLVWRGRHRATEIFSRVVLPSRQQSKIQQKWNC